MRQLPSKGLIASVIIILVLLIDQTLKIWIKTNMHLHDCNYITNWFHIFFTENNGMAYGIELFNKLFLTLFRIIAVSFIGYYLVKFIKRGYKTGFIVCLSLILAGAAGNIIDSVFYGVFFTKSTNTTIATFLPNGGGYSSLFHGKVVDMFHFPIIDTNLYDWIPFVGGDHFVFFSPIFNVADAAISCGIIALLLFYGKYVNNLHHTNEVNYEKKPE